MRYLVHAILAAEHADRLGGLTGWEGGPLAVVCQGPLASVCSQASAVCDHPEVGQLLDHARVVNELFQRVTSLPMRFGCWLDGPAQACDLLRRNEDVYRAGLRELEGCVELGIRVLPADNAQLSVTEMPRGHASSSGATQGVAPAGPAVSPGGAGPRSGVSYLLARKAGYERQDSRQLVWQRVRESIERALAGLFVKSAAEQRGDGRQAYGSLYFLVARSACARFREVYGDLELARPEKMLLTGPWPPYNFATSLPPRLVS